MRVFLRWADAEGYKVDPRLLKPPRVRVPAKEPTVYADPRKSEWADFILDPEKLAR